MIPNVNYFSGGLGKLKNVGGSKFFTTPHTIQVPVEYEIISGSKGNFITCSLDGRLWLFTDRLTALKWNSNSLKMEVAKSQQFNNEKFIARGIDWILTSSSFFQVLDNAPYIFSESVSFDDDFSVDEFFSFLPEISGWQIVKNFLVRRYGNDNEAAYCSLNIPAGLYLTHLEQDIYGKDNSYIGSVSIEDYQLVISQDYSTNANVSGLAFLDKTLYGFKLKNDDSLCPISADTSLFSPQSGSWDNVFDGQNTSGNIFFDPFSYKAIAVRDNTVNLLPEKKIFSAKGISQWFAPIKKIANISDSFVISELEHDILATHLKSGLYREILHQKNLPLTCRAYSNYKMSIGESANVLRVNKIACEQDKTSPDIRLINTFQHSYYRFVNNSLPYNAQVPVFFTQAITYTGIDYVRNFAPASWAQNIITNTPYYWYSVDEYAHTHFQVFSSVSATVFFVDPVTGEPSENIVVTYQPKSNVETYYDYDDEEDCIFIKYNECPLDIRLIDGKLAWRVIKCTYTGEGSPYTNFDYEYEYVIIPELANIEAANWVAYYQQSQNNEIEYLSINPTLSYITCPNGQDVSNVLSYSPRDAIFKDNTANTDITFRLPDDMFNIMKSRFNNNLSARPLCYYWNFKNVNNSEEILNIAFYTIPVGYADPSNPPESEIIFEYFFFVFRSNTI